ncbi:partner and localizer of BRCA2 isoform X2 [Haplochromis burtoni]|uniref:partner and localizer of BRCA2 isoform X2 n=1 Tax=Haplochromis burtoni TaxID=8153 RepID=UPI0006C98107|nr:partner and localizer of BRCA2 isoform X2 [Haplochromis burtoni]
METTVGDILHCEEQLRSTLHSDDKEKLRRKLAELQREYLRTAQRLQRAERLEAVQKHVRSRIAEQNHLEQRDTEAASNLRLNPSSLILNSSGDTAQGLTQSQRHTEGPAESDNSRRNQVIKFSLPSDACPQTPDLSHAEPTGYRTGSSLRLRSRRSRLRWESRSTENNEKGQEQGEGMESAKRAGEEEKLTSDEADAINESEELFSGTDSESPSLLLTHWSTHGYTESGDIQGKDIPRSQEQKEKDAEEKGEGEKEPESLLLTTQTENRGQDDTQNKPRKEGARGEDGGNSRGRNEENISKDTEQNVGDKTESKKRHDYSVEVKEEKNDLTGGGKSGSLMDSCTLVEGLLFPVEYYVRTTRRMTFSQSQPDMQAVIESQLSRGRHRRSRGRAKGQNRSTQSSNLSQPHTQTDFFSLTTASGDPNKPSQAVASVCASAEHSQNSGKISACQMDCSFLPTSARPARGRKRKRGTGRGRSQTGRASSLNTHQSPGTSSWRSLLLPSLSPAQTSLLRLPSLLSGPLMNLDTHQDFHLPDDQFASLKLLKLRQVTGESAVEPFSSPSYNTRSSWRRFDFRCTGADAATPLPLQLSLTPTIASSPGHNAEQLAATQSIHIQSVSEEHRLTDKVMKHSFTEEQQSLAETHSSPTEPVGQKCANVCKETVIVNSHIELQTLMNSADRPVCTENDDVINHPEKLKVKHPEPEKHTYCGVVHASEDLRCINHSEEDKVTTELVSFESPVEELSSSSCADKQACNETNPPGEPLKSPNRLPENQTKSSHGVISQLMLSSPLASAPSLFITPHLPSSTLSTSPKLPSLGLTPHPVTCSLPLTSSPSAPCLNLPPPYSPSRQVLSPPPLSPCPSITYLPPSPSALPPSGEIHHLSKPPVRANQHHTVELTSPPSPSGHQLEDSAGQLDLRTEETKEELVIRHMHTLRAAAGGILVDACCFPGSSDTLCVAAAGKWAVCLWSQASASEWKLIHTWTFSEPVISVFHVPDAAGLICVTLGQLEIREVRVLSCSSLMQILLCEGILQAVIGVSRSRVVTTSHSATGSTLQVFTLSDYSSPSSQTLVSPGVCVGALAPVDGLPDALIGTDEGGHLFVWNLKTGQLLCRVLFGEGFSHTACLRGYSSCGVLFVLLQHQFLSSLEDEEKEGKIKDPKTAFFSLVAINPLSGKSIPATQLYPPETWAGRLCEADVSGSGVVGLSQNGCACVWELGHPGASRMVWAPESEGWQLARWGGLNTLVTGHHNGDVTLYCYSQNSRCC